MQISKGVKMCLDTKLCLVILGFFCSSIIVLNNCRKLDGYKFPVYTTTFCPRIKTEWNERSSALNCNKSNGYMCLPNDRFDELLEFCYREPVERIQKGFCLYLVKKVSLVHSYSCSRFTQGCHDHPFFSNEIYKYPACISIGNGCFLAEPSCKSKTSFRIQNGSRHFENVSTNEWNGSTTTHSQLSSERPQLDITPINDDDDTLLVPIVLGISIPLCILSLLFGYYIKRKYQLCRTNGDVERPGGEQLKKSNNEAIDFTQSKEEIHREEEFEPLLGDGKPDKKSTDSLEMEEINPKSHIRRNSKSHEVQLPTSSFKEDKATKVQESKLERDLFDQWKQDDLCFISTKACEEVEKNVKSKSLVIVAGHSGSGKSAIIQHIALKYREQGWTVKRVKKVEDIINEYSASRFQKNKTICVFNDPLGKESFDEQLNNSWQTYEEELKLYLKTAKLIMSCRNHIISDTRVTRYLLNHTHTVNIDDNKYKLSVDEKRKILKKHTFSMNISKRDFDKIVEVKMYFPLLCKLFSSKEEFKDMGIYFFKEPVTVLKEEIIELKRNDKGKYCALALLVLFNDDLCISEIFKNKDTENKFKLALKLSGLPKRTLPSTIRDNLYCINDFLVKRMGDTYHFYHDFVMEVTTYVFGTDYPAETIKYADIGFLRRRVKLGNSDKCNDSFTIFLTDRYTEELGERLYTELFGERLLDVVLNPCLRNEKVIKVLKEKITECPENLHKLLETKKLAINKQELERTSNNLGFTKLSFIGLENEVGVDVNKNNCFGWTPLMLAAGFDTQEYGDYNCRKSAAEQRDKTVQLLLKNGAHINLCMENGASPLFIACQSGHDSTVQLLLTNGADINLCMENGASPLFIACHNGQDRTVQLLVSNGANINLYKKSGASPLFIACQSGHDSTVQLLLSNGADINSCMENGASPLLIACHNGHDSTVQLLLTNGADINLCEKNGASPLYQACHNGHDSTVQLLLTNGADINLCMEDGASPLFKACQSGHDSTVQLLLSNGADINSCMENGASPLFTACHNGHDSTVQLLLTNGADINLCIENGASLLLLACRNGHDCTVQLLLSNGADINLCTEDGVSPLLIACQNRHNSTLELLLTNGADINLCEKNGASPLFIACQNGHDSTVQILLTNGADINLCVRNGASPLFIACQKGHESTVQILLTNGADMNLCEKNGVSPLLIACQDGHDSTVKLLLTNGADINLCMENGSSPLYVACQNGHESTVQLLLTNGADINLCEKNGVSPLYIACHNGHDRTLVITDMIALYNFY
ncbi:uncharacterized protein [Magallana gigas]|uniref:uncharacterized protein n=1 Tax=Magallana gigas TaxID=29159 RepID=UPI00333EB0F1